MMRNQGLISEWMWRFLAAAMLFTLGWMMWVLYQLTPTPLIKDAAFEAFAKSKAKQTSPQNTQGVITMSASSGAIPAPVAAAAAPVAGAAAGAEKAAAEKATEEKAAAEKAAAEKAAAEKVAAETAAAEKAAAAKPNPAEVVAAVETWARAWAAKDVAGYLAAYAPDFKTPRGEARAAWEKIRTQRVSAPKSISVAIDAPKVDVVSNDQVKVAFRQSYRSDIVAPSVSNKTLVMVKVDGRWLIQQEISAE